MAEKRYFSEKITGVANTSVNGTGITSTDGEPKKVTNIHIKVSAKQDNEIEIWHERERLAVIQSQMMPLLTYTYDFVLRLDFDVPVGKTLHATQKSGGTANNLYIIYEYEIAGV